LNTILLANEGTIAQFQEIAGRRATENGDTLTAEAHFQKQIDYTDAMHSRAKAMGMRRLPRRS
tara:strand:+ start:3583 stop:3771 length:189 start_codon:yes stop_codon:yes gene_type:complete